MVIVVYTHTKFSIANMYFKIRGPKLPVLNLVPAPGRRGTAPYPDTTCKFSNKLRSS
eukprot:SAG31_NODE_3828_length_3844_cov_1.490788_2_plen_57_part_00